MLKKFKILCLNFVLGNQINATGSHMQIAGCSLSDERLELEYTKKLLAEKDKLIKEKDKRLKEKDKIIKILLNNINL